MCCNCDVGEMWDVMGFIAIYWTIYCDNDSILKSFEKQVLIVIKNLVFKRLRTI